MYTTAIVKNLDYKIYDYSKELVNYYEKKESSSNVVIVDIDEKSLSSIGQWPWPRVLLATLVSKINSFSPSAIVMDIIFPEQDRTSPSQIKYFYKNYFNIDINVTGLSIELQNNDAIFAQSLKNSNSVLSVYLSEKNIFTPNRVCNAQVDIPLNYFELPNYPYILQNNVLLSSSSKNFGFINIKSDSDGILRRYQTLKNYQNIHIPSLALATLLSIDPAIKPLGKNSFEIMHHKVTTDKNSRVLLNYYEDKWYKKISALDILNATANAEYLRGKIVILGSSATALHDQVTIPNGKNIAGIKVHVTMIDNLLHDELLYQPEYLKLVNISISLLLTLLTVLLLFKNANNRILLLFLAIIILSITITIYMLWSGVYISIGFLILPFLFHFFIVSILFIFIDMYDRKEFSEELNRSHIAFMDSMSHVAEVHDIETGAHIIRTKKYIKLLSEYIYSKGIYTDLLSKEIINMMYFTAPMHDIGKVGIPDSILKKEGKLTPMEYEVMQTHSDLGRRIINNAIASYKENKFFKMAKNIAHYHHEKWDGSGYPEGLKGDEIPLESRFMAISDVYDALVSKRVYKKAFTLEKTVEIIKEGRGTHFDPVLVDAFLEISDEFHKIAETYRD